MISAGIAAKALELRLAGASEAQNADHLGLPNVDAVRSAISCCTGRGGWLGG